MFPTTCESCHKYSAPNWKDAGFNHNVTTTFALGGAHVTAPCNACHVNNVFKGTPRDCYGCHKTDFQNSKNPPHAASGFPTACDSCHEYPNGTNTWDLAQGANGHTVRTAGVTAAGAKGSLKHLTNWSSFNPALDTYSAVTSDRSKCGKCCPAFCGSCS